MLLVITFPRLPLQSLLQITATLNPLLLSARHASTDCARLATSSLVPGELPMTAVTLLRILRLSLSVTPRYLSSLEYLTTLLLLVITCRRLPLQSLLQITATLNPLLLSA